MKKKIISLLMAIMVMFTMIPVSLADGEVCNEIKGNPDASVTFTETTNKKWGKNDLTLSQNEGEAYPVSFGEEYDAYGCYKVTYTNSDGKSKTKKFTKGSVTLDLKPDQTYTVTVKPYPVTGDLVETLHSHYILKGGFERWKTKPEWTVTAQKNITLCK